MNRLLGFSTRLLLGLFFFAAVQAEPAQANLDLQIDALNVVYSHDFEYLPGAEPLTVGVQLFTSVNCTEIVAFPPFGPIVPPPSFSALLRLVEVSGGVELAEFPIGTIPVASEHVAGRPSGGLLSPCGFGYPAQVSPSLVEFDLPSPSGLEAFLANARGNGNPVQAKVDIDILGEVAETNEINNGLFDFTVVDLHPLTGKLHFGGVAIGLDTYDVANGGCAIGEGMAIDVSGSWDPSQSVAGWDPVVVSVPAMTCIRLVPNGNLFDLVAISDLPLGTLQGKLHDFDVSVDNVILGTTGARAGAISFDLPAGHTVHADDGSGHPEARGRREIVLAAVSPSATTDFGLLHASGSPGFLHTSTIPLSFRVQSMELAAASLTGVFDKVAYQYDVAFSTRDPRRSMGIESNDQRMRQPDAAPIPFALSTLGLDTTVNFDAASGRLHFPASATNWQAYSLDIVQGQLMDGDTLSSEHYSFHQSATCDGCVADTDGTYFNRSASAAAIGWDGASVAAFATLGANPEWGPYDANGGRNIYRRSGDHTHSAVMQVPGFHAQGTGGSSDTSVVQYLLGMRAAELVSAAVVPGQQHLLASAEARSGNHFMAGISVGPSLYSSGIHNQPVVGTLGSDLTQRGNPADPNVPASYPRLSIGFGGLAAPDYIASRSNPGTKYVIRPGGVTGVFNTDEIPNPTVYGYTLGLTRFGIRQVENQVDTFSWVDGSIHVPGKAKFDIAFESLEIECSGDIGKGVVIRETCNDGVGLDVNCGETLSAWKTEMTEILGLEFEGGSNVCAASNRELRVTSVLDIKALEHPVGLSANWSAAGDPSGDDLTSRTEQVFDSPSHQVPGFQAAFDESSIALDGGNNSDSVYEGWFEFGGDIGVPFWESLDTKMRFQNQGTPGNFSRAQSVISGAGCNLGNHAPWSPSELANRLEENCPVEARYEWGGTGFGFGFDVFFETNRYESDKTPRFLGKQLTKDLLVMDAHAGTDFITPEQTQISFGASADFERLRDLAAVVDLHVDLNDPESIRKIDTFLHDAFGVNLETFQGQQDCGPICKVVTEIRDNLNLLNKVADAGIDGFIEEAVRSAVRGILTEAQTIAGDIQFDSALGAIDSLPEEITSRILDSLRAELQALAAPLGENFDSELTALYDQDTATLSLAVAELQTHQKITDPNLDSQLRDIRNRIGGILNVLATVDEASVDLANQGLDGAVNAVATLRTEKAALLAPAQQVLAKAKQLLTGSNVLKACNSNNPVKQQVTEVKDRIADVRDALAALNLVGPLSTVASLVGVDVSAITQAQNTVRQLADDATSRITELEQRVNGICSSYADPLAGAVALVVSIDVKIAGLNTALDTYLDQLDVDVPGNPDPSDGGYIGIARGKMVESRQHIGTVKALLVEVDEFLRRAVDDPSLLFASGLPEHPFLDVTFGAVSKWKQTLDDGVSQIPGISTWKNSGNSFTSLLIAAVSDPVVGVLDGAAAQVTALLTPYTQLLPHPSFDDLEDELVGLIMNSSVIDAVESSLYAFTSELTEDLNVVGLAVFDQLNHVIREVLQAANTTINEAFASATSVVSGWDMGAAEMDGYALMTGDELSRLHVGAEFAMGGEEDGFGFNAALDVTSWSANGKETGCGIDPGAGSLLDVVISTRDLPLDFGESEILITKLYLGFTLQDALPVGLFGGVFTSGEIGFAEFAIFDPGLALGAGAYENYIGARAGAKFESVSMQVAFLVGRTCNQEVLISLDPQAGEFITFPDTGFAGLFVRGGANIPVWNNGCFLTVGVGADAGAWFLGPPPLTVGMLVGGAVFGEGICLVSVRGQITILAELSGITSLNPASLAELIPDNLKLQGEAFFVGGFGFDCDPGTWTNVPRSRKDDWCGTGDLSTQASFDGSFHLSTPKLSAIH